MDLQEWIDWRVSYEILMREKVDLEVLDEIAGKCMSYEYTQDDYEIMRQIAACLCWGDNG